MQAYFREVVLIPNPNGVKGLTKRLQQLRSLASLQSFERFQVMVPEVQRHAGPDPARQAVRHRQPGILVSWLL